MKTRNTTSDPKVGSSAGFAFRVWAKAAKKCVVHASWCYERVMLADMVTIELRLSAKGWDAILLQTDKKEEIIYQYGEDFRDLTDQPKYRSPFTAVTKCLTRNIESLWVNHSHGHEYRLIAALRRCLRTMRRLKANA